MEGQSIPMGGQSMPKPSLKDTQMLKTPNGNVIFQSGILLRTISKFVTQTDEDMLVPLQVFYEAETGKILESSLPAELREEYKDYTFQNAKTEETVS